MAATTTTDEEKNELLERIYGDYAQPGGFVGINQLHREANKVDPSIKQKDVQKFLESNLTYTLHKPKRVRFKRLKTIPAGYMTDLQADLGDFQRLSRDNKGFKYLLVAVDVLTRQCFVAPIKGKTLSSMKEGFEEIFEQMPLKPDRLFTDRGREFISNDMREFFKEHQVQPYTSSHGAIKAGVAERFIRTIKSRLYKYFGDNKTRKWIDVIHPIANAMNHSYCRVIGMRPIDVIPKNAMEVWRHVYGDSLSAQKTMGEHKRRPPPIIQHHAPNTLVRIARERTPFHKGYLPTFSEQIYRVNGVKSALKPITYEIYDDEGKKTLKGRFYDKELSKTTNKMFRIEKVMGRRTTKEGVEQVRVKIYASKEPYWVNLADVTQFDDES
jgi:transposase InsO family protein